MYVYGLSEMPVCDDTQAASDYIHYVHDTQAVSIIYSYYTTPSSVCHSHSLYNIGQIKQPRTYESKNNNSLSHYNNEQTITFFPYFDKTCFSVNIAYSYTIIKNK